MPVTRMLPQSHSTHIPPAPAPPGRQGAHAGDHAAVKHAGDASLMVTDRCEGELARRDSHRQQPRPERLFTRFQVSTERSAFHHNDAAIQVFMTRWHLMPVPNLKIRLPVVCTLACQPGRGWRSEEHPERWID